MGDVSQVLGVQVIRDILAEPLVVTPPSPIRIIKHVVFYENAAVHGKPIN